MDSCRIDVASLVNVASLAVAFIALLVAWYAIARANKTTSAATMVALSESFRSAWSRFFEACEKQKPDELAELLNLLEIACAVCLEGSLSGNSKMLMSEYLNNILRLLAQNEFTKANVGPLLQDASTFIFIKKFLREKRTTLSVVNPPQWFEQR